MNLRQFLSLLIGATLLSYDCPPAQAITPLTIAAAGVTAGYVLDKLDEKATHIIGQAAGAFSLVGAKYARDVQLLISAARQEMHDELSTNWDRLDTQKLSILREIDQSLDRIENNLHTGGKMLDHTYLDIDTLMSRLPFSSAVPVIRRVEGATQYYKDDGIYRVVITGNTFNPFGKQAKISIAGLPIRPEWMNSRAPYDMEVNIPAGFLNGRFQDRAVSYLPVKIEAEVPNRSSSLQVWRDATRSAAYSFSIELLPKYPVTYSAIEYHRETAPDGKETLVKKGPIYTIPGCGNEGCNQYYEICTDVPDRAEPIQIVDRHDSFTLGRWSGMGNDRKTATGMCTTFWQHSHNVTRNVSIDVSYHPAIGVITKREIPLVALSQDPTPPGVLRIGKTYSAQFSRDMQSFDIVLKSFTGEEFAFTPSKTVDGPFKIGAQEDKTDFKRVVLSLVLPW